MVSEIPILLSQTGDCSFVGSLSSYVDNDLDCDDVGAFASSTFPGAAEACDGRFSDCSDAKYDPVGTPDNEQDLDGISKGYVACDYNGGAWYGQGDHSATPNVGLDCDPADPNVTTNTVTWYEDTDGDGFGSSSSLDQCDATGLCGKQMTAMTMILLFFRPLPSL